MTDEKRFIDFDLPIRPEIWRTLSEKAEDSVDDHLAEIERAVSNGYFGVALMLSDHLRATAMSEMLLQPYRLVRLELEYMKRLYYMGYIIPFFRAADRVLECLDVYKHQITPHKEALARFIAIGYKIWLEPNPVKSEEWLCQCREIANSYPDIPPFKETRIGFQRGMEGRVWALKGSKTKSINKFEEGLRIMKSTPRSQVHLQVLFAEHLAFLNEHKYSVSAARAVLNSALQHGLRSHLLLRAILLLLRAPEAYVGQTEHGQLQFRCWILINAIGLSQMETLYPVIDQAKHLLATNSQDPSLFQLERRSDLYRWLQCLNWRQMERAVGLYYWCQGYRVSTMPIGEEVFDLLAEIETGGFKHSVAIQVKHWGRPIKKDNFPRSGVLRNSLNAIKRRGQVVPTHFHWYAGKGITKGADHDIREDLEVVFGRADFKVTTLDDFVNSLMSNPEWLKTIVFSIDSVNDKD